MEITLISVLTSNGKDHNNHRLEPWAGLRRRMYVCIYIYIYIYIYIM